MLETVKVAHNMKGLLYDNVSNWKTLLMSTEEVLGEVGIKPGLFLGNSLSPLLFGLDDQSHYVAEKRKHWILRFGKDQRLISHLLLVDNLFKAVWKLLRGAGEFDQSECCAGLFQGAW